MPVLEHELDFTLPK